MKYTHKLSYMIVFVLLFAVGLFIVGAQDNAPLVQLNPDKAQATAGDNVIVTVNVTGAVGVYGGSFKLSYDPQVFEVVQTDNKAVTPGAFFANDTALQNAITSINTLVKTKTRDAAGCYAYLATETTTLRTTLSPVGGVDTFKGKNVMAIVLSIDTSILVPIGKPSLTVWASTNKPL